MSREFWAYKGNSGLEITSLPISFNDGTKVYHLVEKSALESANAEILSQLKHFNEKLNAKDAEIERYKTFAEHEFKMKDKLYAENARLRAALEVYREFKIGIPHHNGAIIYLAEETLEKLKFRKESGDGK